MKDNFYFIYLMDIIDSSMYENRDDISRQMIETMNRVNDYYLGDLYAPFEITQGDEVAAVMISIASVYDIIEQFRMEFFPVKFRVTITQGKLTAGLDSRKSSIIDGPGFYRCNEMMVQLKKTQNTFRIDSQCEVWDHALNGIVNLLMWQLNRFSKLQQRILRLYQQKRNQQQVAEAMGKSQQQVQSTLETCRWQIIDSAENVVRSYLKKIDKPIEGER